MLPGGAKSSRQRVNSSRLPTPLPGPCAGQSEPNQRARYNLPVQLPSLSSSLWHQSSKPTTCSSSHCVKVHYKSPTAVNFIPHCVKVHYKTPHRREFHPPLREGPLQVSHRRELHPPLREGPLQGPHCRELHPPLRESPLQKPH